MPKRKNEIFTKKLSKRRKRNEMSLDGYTFSDAAHLWAQSQKYYWKPGTYAVYNQLLTKYILPCLGDMKVTKITNQTLDNFISYLQEAPKRKKLSVNYILQICGLVPRVLTYMNKRYQYNILIPQKPVMKKHTHTIILPSENSLILLEHYLLKNCEKDTCLGILIALHTGIRIGELSALTWKDINLQDEIIYIRKNILRVKASASSTNIEMRQTQVIEQFPKTSDSARIIPIPPKLLPFLKKYKKSDSSYLISGVKNPWAEPRTIQYRFKSVLKKCSIEYFNFHMLRHAFASRCVAMGLDIKSLSEILGHSNVQITLNLYVHATTQQKKQFMKQYDSFLQHMP